jgi:hypothetical protein
MTTSRSALAFALIAVFASAMSASAQPPLRWDPTHQLFDQQLRLSSPTTPLPPATPACGPYCDTTAGGTTPTEQGSGSSCSNAQSSLISQLQDIARADCLNQTGFGYCNFTEIITVACFQQSPGVWQTQGHATYNCRDTTC